MGETGADRSHGDGLPKCSCARAASCWCRSKTPRQLRAAVFSFTLAPEDHGGGQPPAHSGRGQGGLGAADAAPGVPAGGANYPLPSRPFTPPPPGCPSRICGAPWSAPWGGWIYQTPCRRGGASWCHVSMAKMASSARGDCARRSLFAPPHAGCGPVHPGRPQSHPPGSA